MGSDESVRARVKVGPAALVPDNACTESSLSGRLCDTSSVDHTDPSRECWSEWLTKLSLSAAPRPLLLEEQCLSDQSC